MWDQKGFPVGWSDSSVHVAKYAVGVPESMSIHKFRASVLHVRNRRGIVDLWIRDQHRSSFMTIGSLSHPLSRTVWL